ncbi:MAG: L,D-transpeptidase family protein [Rhodocyclaceae bacterium]
MSDAGPDATISLILRDIREAKLDDALARTENLLKLYPNFRLAHLIRGDLLLARTAPLKGFGNTAQSPDGKLGDLRDEALVRIQGYATRPQADQIPRYLLQMPDEQKHAVVVDTKRSRLYLYRNDNGRPTFVADFYITQGKDGANKTREGDKRTPVGVYHVTSFLPPTKLTDFYGAGAFPINYPNEWDQRNGRNGHGIWLHGVPSDTYSRPPRASDGCVVLANEDLKTLSNYVQIGRTPVIISTDVEWLSLDDWKSERQALNREIENWRKDWESLDTERYLSHYATDFRSGSGDLREWATTKRRVAAGKSWIKLGVRELSMFRNPGQQEIVVVSFEQDYRSNNLNSVSQKRQYWMKEGGQWKIIYEGNA